jgi:hypothetical protein
LKRSGSGEKGSAECVAVCSFAAEQMMSTSKRKSCVERHDLRHKPIFGGKLAVNGLAASDSRDILSKRHNLRTGGWRNRR